MPSRFRNLALALTGLVAIAGIGLLWAWVWGRMPSGPESRGGQLLVYPAQRDAAPLHGIVVDAQFQPVSGARVVCEPSPGCVHPQLAIGEDRSAPLQPVLSDADGSFHFPSVPCGPWRLRAELADGREGERIVVAPRQGPPNVLRVDAPRHAAVVPVRVTDAEGQPIAAARVVAHLAREGDSILAADHEPDVVARSDVDGYCHLALPALPWMLQATVPDGRVGVELGEARRYQGNEHVRLVVDAAGGIDGVLAGVDPRLLEGSTMHALRITHAHMPGAEVQGLRWTVPVREGAFAFRSLPAGLFALSLHAPSGVCLQLAGAASASAERRSASVGKPCTTVVTPNAVVKVSLQVQLGGTISGRICTDLGRPIQGARVEALLTARSAYTEQWVMHGKPVWRLDRAATPSSPHPTAQASTLSDAEGHYELRGLLAGAQQLQVQAVGRSFEQRLDVAVAPGETTVQDFVLSEAGVLQGVVSDSPYGHLAVLPLGSDQPACLAVLPVQGVFTLPGFAAGEWTLARWTQNHITPLADVRVSAGRTTWVDLRQPASAHFSGRVVDANGNPVVGVADLHPDLQMLGPGGAFAFDRQEPLRPQLPGSFAVWTGGRCFQFSIPEAAIGANDWRGEFRLGPCDLEVALLDTQGQLRAGSVWLSGPRQGGEMLAVPGEPLTLRHLFPGSYTLSARLPGVLVTPQKVELPETTRVVLQTRPAAHIEVRVLHATGRPWSYAPVELYRDAQARPGDRVTEAVTSRADVDGVAHLLSDPGQYWVALDSWARDLYPGVAPVPVEARYDAEARLTLRFR